MAIGAQTFNSQQRQQLLQIARNSIEQGGELHAPISVNAEEYDEQLNQLGCCFVTLEQQGRLRGCVGALMPYQSLLLDVAEHAFAAAYQDGRFPPLSPAELTDVEIEISVLTPAQELRFNSEQELLQQINTGIDGLIIEDGDHRATFLPSVWSKLPQPELFLEQLKLKAGLSPDHWSDNFKAWHYRSESFH